MKLTHVIIVVAICCLLVALLLAYSAAQLRSAAAIRAEGERAVFEAAAVAIAADTRAASEDTREVHGQAWWPVIVAAGVVYALTRKPQAPQDAPAVRWLDD